MSQIVECIPNFSEGRRIDVVEDIENALASVNGIWILDRHVDPDHNRSVLTLAGHPNSLVESLVKGVRTASARIDLRQHRGAHPRVGATDVVPLVPLHNISMEECVQLAREAGAAIAEELKIPVYLYEAAARPSDARRLGQIRNLGFERLRQELEGQDKLHPDFGPHQLHPTAGATFIGARHVLIAFNVNLASDNLELARKIASKIRESNGGLHGIKALGLFMNKTHTAQVSMNLTDYETTGIGKAFEAVRSMAEDGGVSILNSELVGLAPEAAFEGVDPQLLHIEGFGPHKILEYQLAKHSLS